VVLVEGQDKQIEQIPLNTKVAMPLVNEKKLSCFQTRPCTYLTTVVFSNSTFRGLESLTKKRWNKQRRKQSRKWKKQKQKQKKKKEERKGPNLQHLNTTLSLTTTCISEAEFATNFGFVQWEEMEMGMDQATQKSKSKNNSKNRSVWRENRKENRKKKMRRPYGGWVVGVFCGVGGDSAWLVGGSDGPAGLVVAEWSMVVGVVGAEWGTEAGDGRTGGGGSWWSKVLSWSVGWRKGGDGANYFF
jgi:hypothetical protein